MSDYSQNNKQDCKNKHQIVIINKMVKNNQKNIMKTAKKDCKNKRKINIENYLTRKKIYKERMEEIDIEVCQIKTDKN